MLNLYGLKGAAAYMEHAHVLGQHSEAIYAQYHHYMAWLGTQPRDMDTLLDNAMGIGKMNFTIMAQLDKGRPTPTAIPPRPPSTCARSPANVS